MKGDGLPLALNPPPLDGCRGSALLERTTIYLSGLLLVTHSSYKSPTVLHKLRGESAILSREARGADCQNTAMPTLAEIRENKRPTVHLPSTNLLTYGGV